MGLCGAAGDPSRALTNENKEDYVYKKTQHWLLDVRRDEMMEFRNGFWDMMERGGLATFSFASVSLVDGDSLLPNLNRHSVSARTIFSATSDMLPLSWQELQRLACGTVDITPDELVNLLTVDSHGIIPFHFLVCTLISLCMCTLCFVTRVCCQWDPP